MAEQESSILTLQAEEPDLSSYDPYRVLGVNKAASQADIKRAYFRLIRQYTPENDPDNFKIVRAAYDKLRSAERRVETDIFFPQAPPEWEGDIKEVTFDLSFHHRDALFALRGWGDLGRRDLQDDFREIDL